MISTLELERRVIEQELCVNCGACAGMCPYWHSVKGRMTHDFDCSREDGRCVSFCPRMPTDIGALREKFFDTAEVVDEIGPFKGLYMTRSADPAVRWGSQHGGTVTTLLMLALQEGFIDAAVAAKSYGGLSPEGVLAATEQEILECRSSSFQIPASLAVLNRALGENRYKKIGVVGTPCKTLAVYKMMAKPVPEKDNNAHNIGLVIGLFCGWGLDWDGLNALVSRHAAAGSICRIDIPPSKYHCMTVEGGGKTVIDLDEVLPLVRQNCRYCTDMTAEFADISVGGARSSDGWDADKGWNQVIVRSEKGEELLRLAREKGALEFKDVPEGNLDRLSRASQRKKCTGVANITVRTGNPDNLSYLTPSKALFEKLIESAASGSPAF